VDETLVPRPDIPRETRIVVSRYKDGDGDGDDVDMSSSSRWRKTGERYSIRRTSNKAGPCFSLWIDDDEDEDEDEDDDDGDA
jgi:hypothetical protein